MSERNRQGAKIAKEAIELETLFKVDTGSDIFSYLGVLNVLAVSLTFFQRQFPGA
ncbi:MAG TPA: hypothetical protein VE977_14060 [Pyrinomonadaceae bacterium]|nr:hypothetical protein [Pyrinomonadaceae bacterium]